MMVVPARSVEAGKYIYQGQVKPYKSRYRDQAQPPIYRRITDSTPIIYFK